MRNKPVLTKKERKAEKLKQFLLDMGLQDKELTPQLVPYIASKAVSWLGLLPVAELPLRQTLVSFLHKPLNLNRLKLISELLVFGKEMLQNRKVINSQNFEPDYYAVKCICSSICVKPFTSVRLELKITSGGFSCQKHSFHCSPEVFQAVASEVGLRRQEPRRHHPRELTGFEFEAFFKKEDKVVKAKHFNATKTQKGHNKYLRKLRDEADCKIACHYCPVGLTKCGLATHKENWWREKHENHESWFDNRGCLFCLEQEYKQKAGIVEFGEQELW